MTTQNENDDAIVKFAKQISNAINWIASLPRKIWNALPKSRLTKIEERLKETELQLDKIWNDNELVKSDEYIEKLDDAIGEWIRNNDMPRSWQRAVNENFDASEHDDSIRSCITDYYDLDAMCSEDSAREIAQEEAAELIDKRLAEEIKKQLDEKYKDFQLPEAIVKQVVAKALHDILILATTRQYLDSQKCDTEQQQ